MEAASKEINNSLYTTFLRGNAKAGARIQRKFK